MFCARCGMKLTRLSDDEMFCRHCGTLLCSHHEHKAADKVHHGTSCDIVMVDDLRRKRASKTANRLALRAQRKAARQALRLDHQGHASARRGSSIVSVVFGLLFSA